MARGSADKTTRASSACAACRARKHRCSGERPVCARCKASGVACEWPTQQKRGPPKQYIQSLEARLLQTETVLLAILSQVPTESLGAAFEQALVERRGDSHSTTSSTALKHSLEWEEFPLDSSDAIRRWYELRTFPTRHGVPDRESAMIENIPEHGDIPDPTMISASLSGDSIQSDISSPPGWYIGSQRIEMEHQNQEAMQSAIEVENTDRINLSPSANVALQSHAGEQEHTMSARVSSQELRGGSEGTRTQERPNSLNLSEQFKKDYVW